MVDKFYLRILIFLIDIIDYKNKIKIINFFKINLKEKEVQIIDIGAHKGETIEFFLSNLNVKKIYSFEPNKYYSNL